MAKRLLSCVALLMTIGVLVAVEKEPNIQVYTRYPVENGKSNILNCYVNGFHPPKINITLLKNKQEIKKELSDLSFNEDWTFRLLAFAEVVPNGDDEYSCRVEHVTLKKPKVVTWDQLD